VLGRMLKPYPQVCSHGCKSGKRAGPPIRRPTIRGVSKRLVRRYRRLPPKARRHFLKRCIRAGKLSRSEASKLRGKIHKNPPAMTVPKIPEQRRSVMYDKRSIIDTQGNLWNLGPDGVSDSIRSALEKGEYNYVYSSRGSSAWKKDYSYNPRVGGRPLNGSDDVVAATWLQGTVCVNLGYSVAASPPVLRTFCEAHGGSKNPLWTIKRNMNLKGSRLLLALLHRRGAKILNIFGSFRSFLRTTNPIGRSRRESNLSYSGARWTAQQVLVSVNRTTHEYP